MASADDFSGKVLIDFPSNAGWSHLVADSIPLLHKFAERMGVKKCWYENKRGKKRPHYDIREARVCDAVEAGALLVDSRDLMKFLKEHYK